MKFGGAMLPLMSLRAERPEIQKADLAKFDNSTTGRNLSPSFAQPWRHRKRPELDPQGDPEAGSEGQKRPELEQQDDKARRESRSDVAAITYIPLGLTRAFCHT